MRPGEIGWAICLAGLPWSYFFIRLLTPFKQLDIWHANAWWMQASVFVLLGIYASSSHPLGKIPTAVWWASIWATLLILWIFTSILEQQQPYPMPMLAGAGNLWVVMLALLMMTAWTVKGLQGIATAIFWSGVGLTCYGWLQFFQLDQFFRSIDGSIHTDSVVGTIGNPTQFGCQLAIWLPFALMRPGRQWLWSLPSTGLIAATGSSTAVAVAATMWIGSAWRHKRLWGAILFAVSVITGLVFLWMHPEWLNWQGRIETWRAWWTMVHQRPVIGWGLGFTKQAAQQLPTDHILYHWKHLHNEYFQWWVETGAVGVGLVGWALCSLWTRRCEGARTSLRWGYGAAFVATLLVGCLNYPWHLWQLGGWGLAGLAGWIRLTEQVA